MRLQPEIHTANSRPSKLSVTTNLESPTKINISTFATGITQIEHDKYKTLRGTQAQWFRPLNPSNYLMPEIEEAIVVKAALDTVWAT